MRNYFFGNWDCPVLPLVFAFLLLYGCRKDDDNTIPVIKTATVRYITQTTASSGGIIVSEGGAEITSSGVCWSVSESPTKEDNKTIDITKTGNFSSSLSDLIPNAKYYVRAYATNSMGTGYGSTKQFITLAGSVPVLSTLSLSNITQTSATCGGKITSDGGLTIALRGVCYSTKPNPTLADNFTIDGTGIGLFQSNLTGISTGTTYYIRAYATNSFGITYGNELSFSTIVIPTLTTSAFYDLQGISAKAGGAVLNNGGDNYLITGLCWSTSPGPTLSDNFSRSFNSPMMGLLPNTVYYVRAYATNVTGTGYGNQVSFNSGYTLGFNLAGGLVFYNDGDSHGLVSATTDQSIGSSWGCYGTVTYAFSTGINTGSVNTNAIVTGCAEPNFAAKICSDLKLRKYSDWYLPSTDELNLMYVNLHKNSLGVFRSYYYWSSTEFGDIDAWLQDFSSGNKYYFLKSQAFCVRAARRF